MENKKHTKKALLGSVIALILCCAMLIGTTFAWFTDTAASENNVIKSGNLDIAVEYTLDGENWDNLDGATDLFQKGLWEPGHTEIVALKIVNNGSLALEYAANMNIVSETVGKTMDGKDIKLSDILTVSTFAVGPFEPDDGFGDMMASIAISGAFEDGIDSDNAVAFNAANILYEGKIIESDGQTFPCYLKAGQTAYVFVQVDMPESVGNEANHNGTDIPSINFGINVNATQTPYEYDSFGNDYDANATYPDATVVSTDDELEEAIENGDKVIAISGDLTYDWGNYENGANALDGITLIGLNGTDDSITFAGLGSDNDIPNVILQNITVIDSTQSATESNWEYTYLEFDNLTANNVVFESGIMLNGNSNLTGCSINSNDGEYGVWILDGNVTLSNCTFTGARGVKIHDEYDNNVVGTVVIDGCTFNSLSQKPGVAIDSVNAQVEIKNCTSIKCELYETKNTVPTLENNEMIEE